jgi:co-chaperonin GroES (HSP10)
MSNKSGRIPASISQRKIRRVSPLGFRVVVSLLKQAERTETGLYLPEGSRDALTESLLCKVVEVASAMDRDTQEEANISGIPMGATVLIPKNVGIKIPWDEELRIVETKDILAIVDELEMV